MSIENEKILSELQKCRDILHQINEVGCSCSGFALQYEGCCCGYKKLKTQAEKSIMDIIDKL